MKNKTVYIHTIGCQMNVHDSEKIAALMQGCGFSPTPFPEGADFIFLNTCAIREKAQQKAYSFLGRLADLKRRNPNLIIAAGGCVAQQEGPRILERMAHVDLVLGTRAYGRLPDILDGLDRKRRRIVDVDPGKNAEEDRAFFLQPPAKEGLGITRFVTVMQGCDNFCAYCVVPFVRGREISRNPQEIVSEIRGLAAAGVREVTLLGQNVNSYGRKEGGTSFARLLSEINEIEALHRIRFTTSHPKDLSDELVESFRKLGKLCRHIHLPVQSGSDRILERMNRRYTRAHYLERIEALRKACPEIAITTDFIVGFPGEEEADFQETLALMDAVAFDRLFAFKYSDRKGTRAAALTDKVQESVKTQRLERLLTRQKRFTLEKNRSLVGISQQILVDGYSKKALKQAPKEESKGEQWSGRTSGNAIVNFRVRKGTNLRDFVFPGALVNVTVKQAYANSLSGEVTGMPERLEERKGERAHAASSEHSGSDA